MGQPLSIERLETFVVALPARRPHLWVGLDSPAGHGYVLTKVLLSDGSVGWGEAQDWLRSPTRQRLDCPTRPLARISHLKRA